jgi:hypothetical protein
MNTALTGFLPVVIAGGVERYVGIADIVAYLSR